MSYKLTIKNTHGLSVEFLENGSVRSIEADPIRISLKTANPFTKLGENIFLRKRTDHIESKSLLGPESNTRFAIHKNAYYARGSWSGLDYEVTLQLSEQSLSWQWLIGIINNSDAEVEVDMIHVQDAGLKQASDGLVNEYYVSQYTERRIIEDKVYGSVVCCRQNMRESVGNPWLMIACKNSALSASVDGKQFYGPRYRQTGFPEGLLADRLGGEYAGESSVVALQETPCKLAVGMHHQSAFVVTYLPDHPGATSEKDLSMLPALMSEFEEKLPCLDDVLFNIPVRNLFNTADLLPAEDLDDKEVERFFGKERRFIERENGHLLSFFCKENDHVVFRAKEILADRPHGHIMQAEAGFAPDQNILSTTAWAFGVFNSHLKQGNTNFNVLLSVCSSPYNLELETGQRIFVELGGHYYLLGVPSAFEMGLNHCRWLYKNAGHFYEVSTWTSKHAPQVNLGFKVISGEPVNLIITHDFDGLNGWRMIPGTIHREFIAMPADDSMIAGKFPKAQYRILVHHPAEMSAGGDELIYEDQTDHGSPLFVFHVKTISDFCMSFIGEVLSAAKTIPVDDTDQQRFSDGREAQSDWQKLGLNLKLRSDHLDIAAIREILPWYGMNALTHFLTPYGLEQFSGAAWGTRDVAQGPIDLLLTMEKYDEARKVLCIIFSNQNPDGGWPQWWMFDSYAHIRAGSAHGDIYYWCIIALCDYIKVTGDLTILDEILPYYRKGGDTDAENTPLSEHIDRLVGMIIGSFLPGTALVPFDGGDWNDSLQPISRELAQRMISSWTVEMNYQAFKSLSAVYAQTGQPDKAMKLDSICDSIITDFNKYLIREEVVAGYGLVEKDRSISVLLHPTDNRTGIRYSLLPMERGILSGIFSKEQALHHQELIEQHLKGPDGARLMDNPLPYKGGIMTIFQRAESSTYFGREIGLMYVHEHIRYAEALARTGKAEAFMKALRQAIPVGYRDIVPMGDIRQSNCYYSSSDVHFTNRYEAAERYDEVIKGSFPLRGGWRVYSSGPGIFIGMVVTRLLGLRIEAGNVIMDPVMPRSLDGLSASMNFMGYPVSFKFEIKKNNFSPSSISVNGKAIRFISEENKYREGGAVIPAEQFVAALGQKGNIVEIQL